MGREREKGDLTSNWYLPLRPAWRLVYQRNFFISQLNLAPQKKKAPKGTSLDLNSLSSVLMCIHENPNLPYSTVAWFLLFPASLIVLLQLFSTPHLPFDGYS